MGADQFGGAPPRAREIVLRGAPVAAGAVFGEGGAEMLVIGLQNRSPVRYAGDYSLVRPSLRLGTERFDLDKFAGVIPEIDWRLAVLMLNRYADDAEANADRHADKLRPKGESRRSAPKLEAEGD